jgi:hypothetical protein
MADAGDVVALVKDLRPVFGQRVQGWLALAAALDDDGGDHKMCLGHLQTVTASPFLCPSEHSGGDDGTRTHDPLLAN